MKKVSIDFDGTLSKPNVQDYVKNIMFKGIEVHILTARESDILNTNEIQLIDNRDLWDVVEELNIPRSNVRFTGYDDKSNYLKDNLWIFHLDDDTIELNNIYKYTNTAAINVNKPSWVKKCNFLLGLTT